MNLREATSIGLKLHQQKSLKFGPNVRQIELPCQLHSGIFDAREIGAYSVVGNSRIQGVNKIGRFCSFGPGVRIGPPEHAISYLSTSRFQTDASWWEAFSETEHFNYFKDNQPQISKANKNKQFHSKNAQLIDIGNDVWIGDGALIMRGVKIGDGAIIAARAVVTKDVEPYAVVAGIPAKVVKFRFGHEIIQRLLALSWWKYGVKITAGCDFSDIERTISNIESRITDGADEFNAVKIKPFSNDSFSIVG